MRFDSKFKDENGPNVHVLRGKQFSIVAWSFVNGTTIENCFSLRTWTFD